MEKYRYIRPNVNSLKQLESEGLSLVEMSKCFSTKPSPNLLSHMMRSLKIKHRTKSEYIAEFHMNEATMKLTDSQLMDFFDVSRCVIKKAREIYNDNYKCNQE